MTIRRARVGDVLALNEDTVALSPAGAYRSAGVLNRARGLVENPQFSGPDTKYSTMTRLHSGQVVYSKLKAFEQSIAVVDGQFSGCLVSKEFPTFDPDTTRIDTGYLRHVLAADFFADAMRSRSTGMGARRERLHPRDFLELTIPLPGLDEQRYIADRLDLLRTASGSMIQSAAEARERLVALREQALSTARRGKLIAIGTLLHESIDWISVDPTGTYPDAGILNRGRGLFRKPDRLGSETKYRTLFPIRDGQLIYSKLFAWEGSVAMVPQEFHGCYVSSEFPHFDIDSSRVSPRYLGCAVRSNDFMSQLADAGSGMGQRRQRVNVDKFLSLEVWLPDEPTQESAADRWELLDRADALYGSRAMLAAALPQAARNEVFAALL